MDIHIDPDQIKFFLAIVVAGVLYGQYLFRQGLRTGWDDAMYSLDEVGIIQVDDNGEVRRVSDREFRQFQEELQENVE